MALKYLATILFVLAFSLAVSAQCQSGSVCVPQTTIDQATAAAIELKSARAVIASFQLERTATDAERSSAGRLVDKLNAVIATQDKLQTEYVAVIELYKQVVQMQTDLITKLTAQINKPRSTFQKFIDTLKEIAILVGGIAIGRL